MTQIPEVRLLTSIDGVVDEVLNGILTKVRLIEVEGIRKREKEIIVLLGYKGYTSEINWEKVYGMGWSRDSKEFLSMTQETTGMEYEEIARLLGTNYQNLIRILKKLEMEHHLIIKLNAFNCERIWPYARSRTEVVLSSLGTELYRKIVEMITPTKIRPEIKAEGLREPEYTI